MTREHDFIAGMNITAELAAQFFQPLREQWITACCADLMTTIKTRLEELPDGWRLAVDGGAIERGEQPGQWFLRHRFVAIDPQCSTPLPIPAEAGTWTLYGPRRREAHAL